MIYANTYHVSTTVKIPPSKASPTCILTDLPQHGINQTVPNVFFVPQSVHTSELYMKRAMT